MAYPSNYKAGSWIAGEPKKPGLYYILYKTGTQSNLTLVNYQSHENCRWVDNEELFVFNDNTVITHHMVAPSNIASGWNKPPIKGDAAEVILPGGRRIFIEGGGETEDDEGNELTGWVFSDGTCKEGALVDWDDMHNLVWRPIEKLPH
jgi:hypothetical protein